MKQLLAPIHLAELHTRRDESLHEIGSSYDGLRKLDSVREKLIDGLTPGYRAEFDPAEAELAGAFAEDALSDEDADASTEDSLQVRPR